jgi:hypothetical protein
MELNKEELRKLIEVNGNDLYNTQMVAKDDLDILCKEAEETFGVKKAVLVKLVKTYWKSCLEEDKAKFEEFDGLYRSILDREVN